MCCMRGFISREGAENNKVAGHYNKVRDNDNNDGINAKNRLKNP